MLFRSFLKSLAVGGTAALLLSGCGSSGKPASSGSDTATPSVKLVASGFGQQGQYVQGIAIVTSDNPATAGHGVTATANFMDAAGNIIATENQVETISWPNQQLVLPIWLDLTSKPDTKVASIDVSVSVNDYPTEARDLAPLPVLDASEVRPGPYGGYEAAFMFTNNTTEDLKDLRVGVVCYSAAGEIIGGSSEYPSLAPAGKSIRIATSILKVSGEPKTCKAFPNYGL